MFTLFAAIIYKIIGSNYNPRNIIDKSKARDFKNIKKSLSLISSFSQKCNGYLVKPISNYKILANKVFKLKTYPNI